MFGDCLRVRRVKDKLMSMDDLASVETSDLG